MSSRHKPDTKTQICSTPPPVVQIYVGQHKYTNIKNPNSSYARANKKSIDIKEEIGVIRPFLPPGDCPMTRGANFSYEELDSLLEIVEEVLPISATQWETVAGMHRLSYPNANRTVDSIKRKSKQLHNTKIPTGDPVCPPAVRTAKRVRNAIINLMDSSDLNEEEEEDDDEGGGEHNGNMKIRRNTTRRTVIVRHRHHLVQRVTKM